MTSPVGSSPSLWSCYCSCCPPKEDEEKAKETDPLFPSKTSVNNGNTSNPNSDYVNMPNPTANNSHESSPAARSPPQALQNDPASPATSLGTAGGSVPQPGGGGVNLQQGSISPLPSVGTNGNPATTASVQPYPGGILNPFNWFGS